MSSQEGHSISVIHTVGSIGTRSGGPARSVTALAVSLSDEPNIRVAVVTQRYRREDIVPIRRESKVDFRIASSNSRIAINIGWPFTQTLRKLIKQKTPSLLHDHGIWLPSNHSAASIARELGIPFVVHPRGMLEPWALNHRAWKKRLAMLFFQRRDLETASLFVATAPQEVESIRRLGLRQPVAVVPNGVDLPTLAMEKDRNESHHRSPTTRNLVFMSRIHPIKGLINLIDAWARLQPSGWKLRIAGPDEGGHLMEVMSRVRDNDLEHSVEFVGEVVENAKANLLKNRRTVYFAEFQRKLWNCRSRGPFLWHPCHLHARDAMERFGDPWLWLVG